MNSVYQSISRVCFFHYLILSFGREGERSTDFCGVARVEVLDEACGTGELVNLSAQQPVVTYDVGVQMKRSHINQDH